MELTRSGLISTMARTVAEACGLMTDESAELAELALLTTRTSDLHSQMMIVQAHDEMGNSYWMASLRAAFSAIKELPFVPMGACHS